MNFLNNIFGSQPRPTSQTIRENPPCFAHPKVAPTDRHPLPGESKAEPPPPQDQFPLTTNPPKDPRKGKGREQRSEESKEDTTRFEEVWRLRGETRDLEGQIEKQKAEISRLREEREEAKERDITRSREAWQLQRENRDLKGLAEKQKAEISRLGEAEEMLKGKVGRREDRILQLDHDLEKMRNSLQEAEKVHARQTQGMQEQLKRTEELLAARSAELFGAQAFLSTADRLSEMEVLNIVYELNENIYQAAASLAEEWIKMEPPDKMVLDLASRQRHPALVQLARNGDLTGLTFLIQSHLCYYATIMTSSWACKRDFVLTKDLYQRLSASGEYPIIYAKWYVTYIRKIEEQAVSARWRSLTHSYLSAPPPNAESLADELAKVLDETGSSQSSEQLTKFVRTAALDRIEEVIQTAQRLEKVFMVDITSCDMSLIFHSSDVLFDDAKMANEFGTDGAAMPGRRERVAGTTEVGVQKSLCRKPGEPRHVEILLKPKVVLEKDVVGDAR